MSGKKSISAGNSSLKRKASRLRYYYRNREKENARSKIYKERNKDELKEKRRMYNLEHQKENSAYRKRYAEAHKKEIAIQKAKWHKKQMAENINYKLSAYLRNRATKATKRKTKVGSFVRDLGCSMGQFRLFVENQFEEGMTWDNYGKWHLDHVMPLSSFDLTKRAEFLTACNWLNYQPLWATNNLKKGSRA